MKNRFRKRNQGWLLRFGVTVIGILINVILAFLAYQLNFPFYLDTVGTIGVSAAAGMFPGIICAVVTNLVCSTFNEYALFFAFINAIIAICTAWFVQKRNLRKLKYITEYILITGVLSGGISSFVQWALLGGPQNPSIVTVMESLRLDTGAGKFLLFVTFNIIFNVLEKGLSFLAAMLLLRLIPKETKEEIRTGGWRQRPLTSEEIRSLDSMSRRFRLSMNKRMTLTLILVSIALALVLGGTGMRMNVDREKALRAEKAEKAAHFVAQAVDPDVLKDYTRYGEKGLGYQEMRRILSTFLQNTPGIDELYLFRVEQDGLFYVFDLCAEEGAEEYRLGEYVKTELPEWEHFQAGEMIEPMETRTDRKWALSAFYPITDSDGNTDFYAAADVYVYHLQDYVGDFMLRMILGITGFMVLILAYSLYSTSVHMTYPINAIVVGVENFIEAGDDQKKLDKAVKNLRSINVRTGDEIERLYLSVCNMALNQTEQVRGIRHFADFTSKMQDGLIITMADLVENRDSDTGAHIQKTAAYVKIIVEGLQKKGYYSEKIDHRFISNVVRSAPLHDIGKISIPDEVLNKPGKLTDEEYEIIKTHTTEGKKIIEKAIDTVGGENYLKEARNMAAYHHERWDGKGYPEGLHGEVIPLSARIMAVADVFDALTSPRVYKPPFTIEKALSMIEESAGTQFDAKCVEVFMDALPEVKVILRKYREGGVS